MAEIYTGSTGVNGYVDPLAQSFLVERPLYVTKIDVYFSEKDENLPVTLSLRTMNNGTPSSSIINDSQVVVQAADITTSDTAETATSFVFPTPVYLDSGEYAFVITADTTKHKVFISEFGQKDISTGAIISKQPYAGVLFKSSNGTTWQPSQLQDIKFNLYVAKFATTATVDLVPDTSLAGESLFMNKLGKDALTSYEANAVVRASHYNHGLQTGSYVLFTGFPDSFEYMSNANAYIRYNGIPFADLNNTYFTVNVIDKDNYTFTLGSNIATVANITGGTFGSSTLIATSQLPFNAFYAGIGKHVPAKTSINYKISTTDTSYTSTGFVPVPYDTNELSSERVLVGLKNRNENMGGSQSLVYRLELTSEDEYLAPVVSLPFSSITLVTNDVNNPSAGDNITYDTRVITLANTLVSFATSGTVAFGGTVEQANVKTMTPGAFITVAGSSSNDGTYRLVGVDPNGSSVVIAAAGNTTPSAVAEAAGSSVTITYQPKFVAEEAASGTSARSKYFTRKIDLVNPSTALVVRLSIAKPGNSDVEVYYKVQQLGESTTFASKEFTKINFGTIKSTLADEFVDIEKVVDNLPLFTSLMVKVVLRSSDTSTVPKAKDLRIIALE